MVTIIVLILLAGVAIMMLRGDNGILNRASEAKYTNVISGFDEQVKLASMSVRTSIEANKVSKEGYIATKETETVHNTKDLADEVAKELGTTAQKAPQASGTKINTEGYTVAYYIDKAGDEKTNGNTYIVIWYTDNSLRSTLNRTEISRYGLIDIATEKSINQAVLVSVIKIENYSSELSPNGITSTSDANGDIIKEHLSETSILDEDNPLFTVAEGAGGLIGVDFCGKKVKDVVKGDTIKIGDEQFMVLKKYDSENKIMAMPYYNITQSTTDPKQAPSGTGTLAFATGSTQYWGDNKEINIDMTNAANNIQKYITAYSNKLSGVTNGKVTAEVGRYYGDYALSSFSGQSSGGKKILNPSGTGNFWLGSSNSFDAWYVWYVDSSGSINYNPFSTSGYFGVRPVIFISLS